MCKPFRKQHFDWCLFIGHLVLEKVLKAFWLNEHFPNPQPRIHNLAKLAEQVPQDLTDTQKIFLLKVNEFYLQASIRRRNRNSAESAQLSLPMKLSKNKGFLPIAPESVLKLAKKFLKRIEEEGIPVESAYLFGSWVNGRATEFSDIDLAIVSSAFEGTKFYDRRKLDKAVIATDTAIEPHPYRPQDFTAKNLFVKEIIEKGVRIL
ncbi:MAG: nucleotidyltransferase domain-containing protein [Calditrichaeota bacterium]|nr:nucleotidyltransferase domain-containing protein [Calditrichota bacterium]